MGGANQNGPTGTCSCRYKCFYYLLLLLLLLRHDMRLAPTPPPSLANASREWGFSFFTNTQPHPPRSQTRAEGGFSITHHQPRRPTAPNPGQRRRKRAQTMPDWALGIFFFLHVFYILTNDVYIIFRFYLCFKRMRCMASPFLGDLFSSLHTVCLVFFQSLQQFAYI